MALVSTVPEVDIVSPPSEVAPASVYDEPNSTVAGLSPSIVIIGKTVSGGVVVSSVMPSAIITPANIRSCSMIESSKSSDFLSISSVASNSDLALVG